MGKSKVRGDRVPGEGCPEKPHCWPHLQKDGKEVRGHRDIPRGTSAAGGSARPGRLVGACETQGKTRGAGAHGVRERRRG